VKKPKSVWEKKKNGGLNNQTQNRMKKEIIERWPKPQAQKKNGIGALKRKLAELRVEETEGISKSQDRKKKPSKGRAPAKKQRRVPISGPRRSPQKTEPESKKGREESKRRGDLQEKPKGGSLRIGGPGGTSKELEHPKAEKNKGKNKLSRKELHKKKRQKKRGDPSSPSRPKGRKKKRLREKKEENG